MSEAPPNRSCAYGLPRPPLERFRSEQGQARGEAAAGRRRKQVAETLRIPVDAGLCSCYYIRSLHYQMHEGLTHVRNRFNRRQAVQGRSGRCDHRREDRGRGRHQGRAPRPLPERRQARSSPTLRSSPRPRSRPRSSTSSRARSSLSSSSRSASAIIASRVIASSSPR